MRINLKSNFTCNRDDYTSSLFMIITSKYNLSTISKFHYIFWKLVCVSSDSQVYYYFSSVGTSSL